MIKIHQLTKSFSDIPAVNHLSLTLGEEEVFGLVGTNGAGKTTLLRLLSGILRPDEGKILIDEQEVWDNPKTKELIYFIPDDPWFFPNSNAMDLRDYLKKIYPAFDSDRYDRLIKDFGLIPKRRTSHYSKGMKKQLAVIAGICTNTKYLFMDETFDGLDPVMRQGVKSLFAGEIETRGLTPIIASHNLRELEDICDHVGLLHQGGLLMSQDLSDLKLGIIKLQCVFENENDAGAVFSSLKIKRSETRGRLHTLVVAGTKEEILAKFKGINTIFLETLPLTLEEIFITETEVVGYDVKKIIYG